MQGMHKRQKPPDWVRRQIACSQRWKCEDCDELLDWAFEIDHRVPLFQGGTNESSNLAAICSNCHARKSIMERSRWCCKCADRITSCVCARDQREERPMKRRQKVSHRQSSVHCTQCGTTSSHYFKYRCICKHEFPRL